MSFCTHVLGKDVQSVWRGTCQRRQIGRGAPTMTSTLRGWPTNRPCRPSTPGPRPSICCSSSFLLRCCASLLSCRFGAQNRELHNANHMDSAQIPTDASQALHGLLKAHWGFEALRPHQVQPVHDLALGKHVLALMPTGAGKSMCFQLPALARGGLCIVITPLVALMQDQCDQLRSRGIRAEAWVGGNGDRVLDNVRFGQPNSCTWPQSGFDIPCSSPARILGCPDSRRGRGALHFPMGT